MDAPDAYQTAIQFLLAGALPIIIEAEDGIHVLSVFPTNREAHCCMHHENDHERMKFMVRTVVAVKQAVEEANV